LLFDVPFDRSQSALPVPVFNNDGGVTCPAAEHFLGRLALCAARFLLLFFFEVVDGQTLIKGVFLFYF